MSSLFFGRSLWTVIFLEHLSAISLVNETQKNWYKCILSFDLKEQLPILYRMWVRWTESALALQSSVCDSTKHTGLVTILHLYGPKDRIHTLGPYIRSWGPYMTVQEHFIFNKGPFCAIKQPILPIQSCTVLYSPHFTCAPNILTILTISISLQYYYLFNWTFHWLHCWIISWKSILIMFTF